MGGPRGLSSQPDWANLPTVFVWTVLCIWVINNFVRSIMGKALNAVRDEEMAANAMTVNTRRTKIVAFMFAAFWAGVAGGLFAHVLRYVNPNTFGITKLAEVLAMVYFGGLNSVYGSSVGALSLSLVGEALHGIDFQIDEGEIVTIIGANGVGKSNCLRAISRMVPVDKGTRMTGQNFSRKWFCASGAWFPVCRAPYNGFRCRVG